MNRRTCGDRQAFERQAFTWSGAPNNPGIVVMCEKALRFFSADLKHTAVGPGSNIDDLSKVLSFFLAGEVMNAKGI